MSTTATRKLDLVLHLIDQVSKPLAGYLCKAETKDYGNSGVMDPE